MRGSTALFLAGAAAIVSGTVAPAFSADEPARVAPAPAAESASDVATGAEAPVGIVEPEEGSPDELGGLERPSLEPAIDERTRDRERDRDAKAKARKQGAEGDKQPLANASVTMKNIQFKPKTLRIAPGDRVTWTNRDMAQHDAVERNEEFETRLLSRGESASVTIDSAGTYKYICTVHPTMKGTLIAETGGSSTSGTSSTGGSTGSTGTSTGTSTGSTSSGTGTPSSTGSTGSLPRTGQEQLPLLILGAGLIVFGLLARAFHEYWIWR